MAHFESWREEKQAEYLYAILAQVESGSEREILFRDLAKHAAKQAEAWRAIASRSGEDLSPQYTPPAHVRFAALLIRKFGPRAMRPILGALKVRGISIYSSRLSDPLVLGHLKPNDISEIGKRHKLKGGGTNIRAAVFGINDGVVSNAGLILGVAAAASMDTRIILVSGTAGLLAGALSMAAGEYVSVQSQRELIEYQLALERAELEQYPEEEAEELAIIYAARGLPKNDALVLARKLIANPVYALNTLAREELGLDPDELGSAWGAARASFIAFSVGAIVPLLPFILAKTRNVVWISIGLTALTLFVTGAFVSFFSGKRLLASGFRMLAIGGGAGLISYFIGTLIR